MEAKKRCSGCYESLPIHAFGPWKWSNDGYDTVCRRCKADRTKLRTRGFRPTDIIRPIKENNRYHLELAVKNKIELTATGIESKIVYRVLIHYTDMPVIEVWRPDGKLYHALHFCTPDLNYFLDVSGDLFKRMQARLAIAQPK